MSDFFSEIDEYEEAMAAQMMSEHLPTSAEQQRLAETTTTSSARSEGDSSSKLVVESSTSAVDDSDETGIGGMLFCPPSVPDVLNSTGEEFRINLTSSK